MKKKIKVSGSLDFLLQIFWFQFHTTLAEINTVNLTKLTPLFFFFKVAHMIIINDNFP